MTWLTVYELKLRSRAGVRIEQIPKGHRCQIHGTRHRGTRDPRTAADSALSDLDKGKPTPETGRATEGFYMTNMCHGEQYNATLAVRLGKLEALPACGR